MVITGRSWGVCAVTSQSGICGKFISGILAIWGN